MNSPSLLIQFDSVTLTPIAVFPNGTTAEETTKLQDLADRMLKSIEEDNETN